MARSTACAIIVLALALAPATARGSAGPKEMDARAAAHLQDGVELHEQGRYADAAQAFAAGHGIDPQPVFLFAWAQAERLAGNCDTAIDLYKKYMQSGPSRRQRAAAMEQIEACQRTLDATEPEVEPQPARRSRAEPAPAAAPGTDAPPPRARRVDPVGVSLVTIGSVAIVSGVALLASAGAQRSVALDAQTYDDYEEAAQRRRNLAIAGGIVGGIGVPLVVAGAIVWAKRDRKARRATPTAWLGPETAGAAINVRF